MRRPGDFHRVHCAKVPRFTAAMVCASRIVTTGIAGSDDARNAPADKDHSVAGARDDPT